MDTLLLRALFQLPPITRLAAVDFLIQAAAGAVAIGFGTEMFYDLTGSATFLVCVLWCYTDFTGLSPGWIIEYRKNNVFDARRKIQTACVVLWAGRLGAFLFSRVLREGRDRRFKKALKSPGLFAFYWFLQGVWVIVTLYPTLLVITEKHQPATNFVDWLGWSMFVVGFLFEAVADFQKYSFRANQANKEKFISTGLWSISRHPNYFGEILLWFGLWLPASSVFPPWDHYRQWALAGLSPLFVAYLLVKVSGVPILERSAKKKWGDSKEYKAYVSTVPKLVPFTPFY